MLRPRPRTPSSWSDARVPSIQASAITLAPQKNRLPRLGGRDRSRQAMTSKAPASSPASTGDIMAARLILAGLDRSCPPHPVHPLPDLAFPTEQSRTNGASIDN